MLKQILGLILSAPLFLGCSGTTSGVNSPDGSTGAPGCVGRACNINWQCPAELGPTTLTGTVTIPAGTLPLYNAQIFIPSGDTPPPQDSGASCLRCDQIIPSDAAASTETDFEGRFTLVNAPHGDDIPVVIRVGKWQRIVTVKHIDPCTRTALDRDKTRMPRNKTEGNIPLIALTTGGADALECLLRRNKLGLDDTEFTTDSGSGRVHLFVGGSPAVGMSQGATRFSSTLNGGASFPPANPWWDHIDNLAKYDTLILSCEGDQVASSKSQSARSALLEYINRGGRVFASHWHNIWIAGGPMPLSSVASFVGNQAGTTLASPSVADINMSPSFPKGVALASWLQSPSVAGSTTQGKLVIYNGKSTTLMLKGPPTTQTWVTYTSGPNVLPQYFSFNAPIGAIPSQQCGQMVFTDIHVSGSTSGDTSDPTKHFPTGCITTSLSPQEKALIFMLFDLTGCLEPIIG
jgi:hypothetical protein